MFDTSLYRGSLTLLRTTPIINWIPIQRCMLMLFMACGLHSIWLFWKLFVFASPKLYQYVNLPFLKLSLYVNFFIFALSLDSQWSACHWWDKKLTYAVNLYLHKYIWTIFTFGRLYRRCHDSCNCHCIGQYDCTWVTIVWSESHLSDFTFSDPYYYHNCPSHIKWVIVLRTDFWFSRYEQLAIYQSKQSD